MAEGEVVEAIRPAPSGADLDALLAEIPPCHAAPRQERHQASRGDIDDLCQLGMLEPRVVSPSGTPRSPRAS